MDTMEFSPDYSRYNGVCKFLKEYTSLKNNNIDSFINQINIDKFNSLKRNGLPSNPAPCILPR